MLCSCNTTVGKARREGRDASGAALLVQYLYSRRLPAVPMKCDHLAVLRNSADEMEALCFYTES